MDLCTTKFIAVISAQNVELAEELALLKSEINALKEQLSKMNEPRIEFNPNNSCCGKTSKGNCCPIKPDTILSGKWYCWAHIKRI
jgi:hypothetical protein